MWACRFIKGRQLGLPEVMRRHQRARGTFMDSVLDLSHRRLTQGQNEKPSYRAQAELQVIEGGCAGQSRADSTEGTRQTQERLCRSELCPLSWLSGTRTHCIAGCRYCRSQYSKALCILYQARATLPVCPPRAHFWEVQYVLAILSTILGRCEGSD